MTDVVQRRDSTSAAQGASGTGPAADAYGLTRYGAEGDHYCSNWRAMTTR